MGVATGRRPSDLPPAGSRTSAQRTWSICWLIGAHPRAARDTLASMFRIDNMGQGDRQAPGNGQRRFGRSHEIPTNADHRSGKGHPTERDHPTMLPPPEAEGDDRGGERHADEDRLRSLGSHPSERAERGRHRQHRRQQAVDSAGRRQGHSDPIERASMSEPSRICSRLRDLWNRLNLPNANFAKMCRAGIGRWDLVGIYRSGVNNRSLARAASIAAGNRSPCGHGRYNDRGTQEGQKPLDNPHRAHLCDEARGRTRCRCQ
jgi:hypothetical protein